MTVFPRDIRVPNNHQKSKISPAKLSRKVNTLLRWCTAFVIINVLQASWIDYSVPTRLFEAVEIEPLVDAEHVEPHERGASHVDDPMLGFDHSEIDQLEKKTFIFTMALEHSLQTYLCRNHEAVTSFQSWPQLDLALLRPFSEAVNFSLQST